MPYLFSMSIDLTKMDLLDIIPKKSEITLNGKEYELRPVSLSDETWMNRQFGSELQAIFSELRMIEICRIVYHLLADRRDFPSEMRDDFNDDGDPVKLKVKGYEVLMGHVHGKKHQLDIINALLENIGLSQPLLDKATSSAPLKKKTKTKKR